MTGWSTTPPRVVMGGEAAQAGHRRLSPRPWTLHQLCHSAFTRAAEAGANTDTLLTCRASGISVAAQARVPQFVATWSWPGGAFRWSGTQGMRLEAPPTRKCSNTTGREALALPAVLWSVC